MGQLMYDLGNIYKTIAEPSFNSSKLFWALIAGPDRKAMYEKVQKADFDAADKRIDEVVARVDSTRMQIDDAELIKSEVRNTAAMLKLGAAPGAGSSMRRTRMRPSWPDAFAR